MATGFSVTPPGSGMAVSAEVPSLPVPPQESAMPLLGTRQVPVAVSPATPPSHPQRAPDDGSGAAAQGLRKVGPPQITCLPATDEFVSLVNEVAMPLMKRAADLGTAYQHLMAANKIFVEMHGFPSHGVLYNMACCFSLAAAAGLPDGLDPSPGLPPTTPTRDLASARLDIAASMLDAATQAGPLDMTMMITDPDLEALRRGRAARFAATMQRPQHTQPCGLSRTGPSKAPPSKGMSRTTPVSSPAYPLPPVRMAKVPVASSTSWTTACAALGLPTGVRRSAPVYRWSPTQAVVMRSKTLTM